MTFVAAASLPTSVKHGFFDRHGGVSSGIYASANVANGIGDDKTSVDQNRQRCLNLLGYEQDKLCFGAKLAHSNKVYIAADSDGGRDIEGYDAIITQSPGLVIGISTADCLPIVLAAQNGVAVGIVHVGWRGLVAGVITNTVSELTQLDGVDGGHIKAALGPVIAAQNYQVDNDVARHFEDSQALTQLNEHKWQLNIALAAHEQLKACGVMEVELLTHNTFAEKYFSYRRDNGTTGRQLSCVVIS